MGSCQTFKTEGRTFDFLLDRKDDLGYVIWLIRLFKARLVPSVD